MTKCELCEREKECTEHHLIPRTLHSNKWFEKNFSKEEMRTRKINLCKDCHRAVHDFINEKTLGKEFNTKELLLSHPRIEKHVEWISKR